LTFQASTGAGADDGRSRGVEDWLWLAAAVPMAGLELGRRVLVNNDEARFPLLAQDILARGAWVLPQLNGQPYLNKPPLLPWLIALASHGEGRVTPLTAALPSALAGVATVAVIYALGRDCFGPRAARSAALVAVAAVGFVLHARLAMPDMLLTCWTTASAWMLWRALHGRRRAWLGFWGLAAAGFWTKGPPGLLTLVIGVVAVVALGRPYRWAALAPARGIPLWLLAAAPWIALTVAAGPARAAHVALDDQVRWYLSGALHAGRLLDPLRNLAGIVYPWVLVVPFAAVEAVAAVRRRDGERTAVTFVLAWGTTVLVAVALSSQQRLRYYLPALPPAALLIGWWMVRPAADVRSRRVLAAAVAAAAIALVGAAGLAALRWRPAGVGVPGSPVEAAVGAAAPVAVAVALLAGRLRPRRRRGAFVAAWAIAAAVVLAGYHREVGRLNVMSDYPGLRARLGARLDDRARLGVLDVPELPAAFYLERPVTVLSSPAEVPAFVIGPPPGIVLVGVRTLAAVPGDGRLTTLARTWLALRPAAVIGLGDPATPG
jgi:4-amino-4-deoxy-L-arabinose transferase-like glycosyltransferase